MKRTLLFALVLIAAGCADAEKAETPAEGSEQVTSLVYCEGIETTFGSPLEDLVTCAEQGFAYHQFILGEMYRKGEDVPEDDAEAVRWYRLAAEQWGPQSQYRLGSMYQDGEGVPQDDVLAYMWYNLAAANGIDIAPRSKALLENFVLTREQIAEAQRMSREWMAEHPRGGN